MAKYKNIIWVTVNGIISFGFFILIILSLWAGHLLASVLLILALFFLFSPLFQILQDKSGIKIPGWLRWISVPLLFFLFIILVFMNMGNPDSIYKNGDIEAGLMKIYDQKMKQWPTTYESRYIKSDFGKVHVIISGPDTLPPLILLHASAMAGWSWQYNIAELNKYYKTYAIDMIGDAGRSQLNNAAVYPRTGKELAMLYTALLDSLSVDKADFIGASAGGFAAANIAVHLPQRVKSLILCGPMGFAGTNLSVLQIVFTTMFPVPPLQDHAFHWAFGDAPHVKAAVKDWFYMIVQGVVSRQVRPVPFTLNQLKSLQVPVMFLLGNRDGLVGDPGNMEGFIHIIPNAKIHILNTGHLISAEKPDEFNRLILEFYSENNK